MDKQRYIMWNEAKPKPEVFHIPEQHVYQKIYISPNLLDRKNPDKRKTIPYYICVGCSHGTFDPPLKSPRI